MSTTWTMGQLDARLHVLEDASEKGELVVSARLAEKVAHGLPGIAVGIPITQALETVFQEQATLLSRRSIGSRPPPGPDRYNGKANSPAGSHAGSAVRSRLQLSRTATDPAKHFLDVRAAAALTQRIKTEINQVCLLLAEAHDLRAWAVLGYPTWDQYVRKEFGYSRSRSYEILDQARAVRAIQHATGTDLVSTISAYTARQIKPFMQAVVNEIRDQIATAQSPDAYKEIVDQVVAVARWRASASTTNPPAAVAAASREADDSVIDWAKLCAALDYIAGLPLASDAFVTALRKEPSKIDLLRSAIRWLLDLSRSLEPV